MTARLTERDLYFVIDPLWKISYLDGYNAVIYTGLYEYIKENRISSFLYHIPVEKKKEFSKLSHMADIRSIHSGASYGVTMRMVEMMIKMGFDDWKIWYIKSNRIDIVEKVKIISRQVKKSLSNPEYKMCKKRLIKEYFELII